MLRLSGSYALELLRLSAADLLALLRLHLKHANGSDGYNVRDV
jgi:hypothetical protein